MMKRIKECFVAIIYNIYSSIYCKTHPRDNRVILFGSWMGNRFADNSRFLFEYLSENKDKYGLRHVVWATRDPKIFNDLKKLKYETCLIGTKDAKKWHLTSGTHIICNNAGYGSYKPDIDTKYSWGAKKIQLWHGVGFKAVGSSSNAAKGHKLYRNFINRHRNLKRIISFGGWSECKILSTSSFDQKIMVESQNTFYSNVFISAYPRYLKCLKVTNEEKNVIDIIKQYSFSAIYLPTFRENYSEYVHPLSDKKFRTYLKNNNILWIEKQHSVSNYSDSTLGHIDNVLFLDPKFDINVLYDFVNCVVSDYSSTICDGIYKNIPTIMYVPDIEQFANGSGGLLLDIKKCFAPIITKNINGIIDLFENVMDRSFWNDERKKMFSEFRNLFFGNNNLSYDEIWNDIESA